MTGVQTPRRAELAWDRGAGACRARPVARALPAVFALVALLLLVAACTDPRAQPEPPTVQITLSPNLVVASPGVLYGTVRVHDETGIDSIRVAISRAVCFFVPRTSSSDVRRAMPQFVADSDITPPPMAAQK